MQTQAYRTRTILQERKNFTTREDIWGIAIDIGYSGTKIYSPNIIACFPSYAARVSGNLLQMASTDENAILYKDENGEIWKVGKIAQDAMSPDDADSSSMAIYGRKRYFDPMFLVIARTAIGIASRKNAYGDPEGKKICLETGLPNSYIRMDAPLLKEVFTGHHTFDLRIGTGDWQHFDLTLDANDIFVMQQPMGTLLSITTDDNGNSIPDAVDYYSSALLIIDPGFGTFDCFSLKGAEMAGVETYTAYSMKQVFANTVEKIQAEYGTEIPVPTIQKYLDAGFFTQYDRKTRTGKNIPFEEILNECSREVAQAAVDKVCEVYGDLLEFKYLVITGGTGEAWYEEFANAFKGLPNLKIIPGNVNTDGILVDEHGNKTPLPFIFSNVRGYYMYLQHKFG